MFVYAKRGTDTEDTIKAISYLTVRNVNTCLTQIVGFSVDASSVRCGCVMFLWSSLQPRDTPSRGGVDMGWTARWKGRGTLKITTSTLHRIFSVFKQIAGYEDIIGRESSNLIKKICLIFLHFVCVCRAKPNVQLLCYGKRRRRWTVLQRQFTE